MYRRGVSRISIRATDYVVPPLCLSMVLAPSAAGQLRARFAKDAEMVRALLRFVRTGTEFQMCRKKERGHFVAGAENFRRKK